MEHVPGSFGTSASFALRFGQTIFSSASLIFMCMDYDFYDFTTFCYLTTVMAFVTPWSISLALTDTYSVLLKQLPHEARVVSMVVAGDFILSFLSLGGACGVASATELLSSIGAPICGDSQCSQYQAFRCSNESGVNKETISKYMDTSGIQPYVINRNIIVYFNQRRGDDDPRSRNNSVSRRCKVCEWDLVHTAALFCSVECKFRNALGSQLNELMENSSEDVMENSLYDVVEPIVKTKRRRKGIPYRSPFY
ncbi:unnamed protein product [Thlaspi arvense]|uniref:CASP-like protein n=1 Tax=Thlaspi arvense TaxID=13288 RepID=A0AAU9SIR5_THLAR|nr:unnamed protein product [Thlaspi arvense]